MARLKDYYKELEVTPLATVQEIKQAYRKLAFQYHPDKNPGNTFAEAHFKELQEAYSVLSNTHKRRKYDEVRWLNGMSMRSRTEQHVTPQWVLEECKKLSKHMAGVDTYRMSHSALEDYILLLLSDAHMSVLQQQNDIETNRQIILEILVATHRIHAKHMKAISGYLVQLANGDTDMLVAINNQVKQREQHEKRDKYMPWWIVIATILLCLLMFIYGRK
jgi:molecular chaperone DnaJ